MTDSNVWPCGCVPFSSDPMDYCREHRLTLGSLEQRILSTTMYLYDLVRELNEKKNKEFWERET